MRILYNGNVGIGIPEPVDKLAVNGTVHAKEVKVDMMVGQIMYSIPITYSLL